MAKMVNGGVGKVGDAEDVGVGKVGVGVGKLAMAKMIKEETERLVMVQESWRCVGKVGDGVGELAMAKMNVGVGKVGDGEDERRCR